MDDRELLEMAAKAAGVKLRWIQGPEDEECIHPIRWNDERTCEIDWNPLEDDGDALRLAMQLCMTITTGPCQCSSSTIGGALRGFFPREDTIHQQQDAAVRRVIVRAAAEIGKAMP